MTFVMVLATIVTYLVQKLVLQPFDIGYLQTIAFILIIAALVQMVEIILKKVSPSLYQALGIYLPLITTNCTILGVALLAIQKDYNLLEGVVLPFQFHRVQPGPGFICRHPGAPRVDGGPLST